MNVLRELIFFAGKWNFFGSVNMSSIFLSGNCH